ncbi:related to alcohol dehydrogenase, class C [Phialocephala subalpina]|uniref:Related to alcohol dehydrogenase, class C n=1 Tax=Phialocephala subalpina TaxID=576137 RepID=A0A1L7X995_9HELO|nr:related to alcohol dehydrogenase, class C [Phialocephala subalpina]
MVKEGGSALAAILTRTELDHSPYLGHEHSADQAALQKRLKIATFEPKNWEETDIDVKVTHCGVCFSDLCMLRSSLEPSLYPCCASHETVGEVVRVGKLVKRNILVGDRVGIGPLVQVYKQSDCYECPRGMSSYCSRVANYGGILPDGSKTYGGLPITVESRRCCHLNSEGPGKQIRSAIGLQELQLAPEDSLPSLDEFLLSSRNISLHFNSIGSVAEIKEMLDFAVERRIKPWVEERKMREVNNVLREMRAGMTRYCYVLANDSSEFRG